MSRPERYEVLRFRSERAGVVTRDGFDRATNLPVLIYEFDSQPPPFDGLRWNNIPKIVWSGEAGARNCLVTALPSRCRQLSEEANSLSASRLLDFARALRDAALSGLPHGDLRPERLLVADRRLLIEGYGVPWQPDPGAYRAPEIEGEGTLAGDVWSFAATIRSLGTGVLDETVEDVITLCSAGDPTERPSAEELYLALEALLPGAAIPAPASTAPPTMKAKSAASWSETWATEADTGREAAATWAGLGGEPRASGMDAGEVEEASRDSKADERRRLALLGVLMAAVVALALLAVYGPRGGRLAAAPNREATVYVIEVRVEPPDLPPVTIHLVSGPDGSELTRGERLGTAPRHLALDRAGSWAFQGSIQDRRSPVVQIEVPEERMLTLTVPP